MLKLSLYTSGGIKKESINMPKNWLAKVNQKILAQAIRVYSDHTHPGLAKAKTRGDVSISTKKIYRQKGTGGARHGAKSAPIFVGGGVTHGPKGLKRKLRISRKMGQKALVVALNMKASEGQLIVVNNLSSLKKTKDAAGLLGKIAKSENKLMESNFTLVLSKKNKDCEKVFRNLNNVNIAFSDELNAYKVYFGGLIMIDADSLVDSEKTKTKVAKSISKKLEPAKVVKKEKPQKITKSKTTKKVKSKPKLKKAK